MPIGSAVLKATGGLFTLDLFTVGTAGISTATQITEHTVSLNASTLLTASSAHVRVTQAGLETVYRTDSNIRITQSGVELVYSGHPNVRISQFGIELVTTPGGTNYVQVSVSLQAVGRRTVPVSAVLSVIKHTVPVNGQFASTPERWVVVSGSIGLRRTVPINGQFQGTPARLVPSFAMFNRTGYVPVFASFWQAVDQWIIRSDTLTKVMSLASHLMGGSVSTLYGVYAQASTGPYPAGWTIPSYNDGFWPYGFVVPNLGLPIPFPGPADGGVLSLNFFWGWPNLTGDYSQFGDPFNDIVLLRKVFGLPVDANIARFTTGELTVSVAGIFSVGYTVVQINGKNLQFVNFVAHPGGDVEAIFNVPSGILQPQGNVIAMAFTSFISQALSDRSGAFRLVLHYRPANNLALPQIIG